MVINFTNIKIGVNMLKLMKNTYFLLKRKLVRLGYEVHLVTQGPFSEESDIGNSTLT